ncbi:MAG: hypothetical protein D6765_01820 [Bacteroidetes bacterium]|nr:MAG: hypothetical protein D6765_01820 [Bacteroidota bacterium]
MKWHLFLLAGYLLGLSLMPCADGGAGTIQPSGCLLVEKAHDPGADQDPGCTDDDCSPLCSCQCCSNSLDQNPFREPLLEKRGQLPSRTLPSPRFSPGVLLPSGIFQPPKFG